jgi:hypothetical protein
MDKIYLWLYGGYGDCVVAYMHGGLGLDNKIMPTKCGKGSRYWDKIGSIKKLHPSSIIRAVVISGNPMAAKLALRNPYIDEVVKLPTLNGVNTVSDRVKNYILQNVSGHIDVDYFIESAQNIKKYKSKKNEIYLSNLEKLKLDSLKKVIGSGYVVMHPFASIDTRRPVISNDYIALAEEIYKQTQMKSIVVGGSFSKTKKLQSGQFLKDKVTEEFSYESDAVINIVNESSILLDTKLVLGARAVIGSWSCHTTTGLSIAKPTVVYTTQKAYNFFEKITKKKFKRGLRTNKTFLTNKITPSVLQQTIQHLKDNK